MDRVLGYAIFTQPQVGRAGLSLEQAKEQGFKARMVELPLEQVARATEVGFTTGLYQMVVNKENEKILGATLVSPNAGELVHVFIDLMDLEATWHVLARAVHIHPTFAEGLPTLARKLAEK
jgi:dihydrolipoamide dehydrogenase